MNRRSRKLTQAILIYIAVDVFGYSYIIAAVPSLKILFLFYPAVLFVWQLFIIRGCFNKKEGDAGFLSISERIGFDDLFGLFLILWIGHRPLATDYLFGFFVFSGIVVALLCGLAFTASVEIFRKKAATPLVYQCLFFVCFLLTWEKNTCVFHYGVPVIGHFFEKPEYRAQYRVEVEPENSSRRFKAIADIHVEGRTETEDGGEEDRFGLASTYTRTYRDVWVKKLYLPNGGVLDIAEQEEPLHLGESVRLRDSRGRSWHVRLLNEPIL
jgi:hypothetical protein